MQLWSSLIISNVTTIASKPQRSFWIDLSQRVRISNTLGSTGTIKMQLQKTVSRLMFVILAHWWSTRTCVFQNTMSVIFGLRPSSTQPTWTTIPLTCCLCCLLLNCFPDESCFTAPVLTPILGDAMCKSFKIGSRIEESYLSGRLGLEGVNIWVYLPSIPVQLG